MPHAEGGLSAFGQLRCIAGAANAPRAGMRRLESDNDEERSAGEREPSRAPLETATPSDGQKLKLSPPLPVHSPLPSVYVQVQVPFSPRISRVPLPSEYVPLTA